MIEQGKSKDAIVAYEKSHRPRERFTSMGSFWFRVML